MTRDETNNLTDGMDDVTLRVNTLLAQDMLIKSALAEIERLKARLREVEAERDDTGFRLRLYEVAYEDAVTAIRKLSEDMATAHTAPIVEPTPEPGFDYWYDHANGRYQRY